MAGRVETSQMATLAGYLRLCFEGSLTVLLSLKARARDDLSKLR